MAASRGRRKKRNDDIPVASFSDVAFLLIIFFILVTTLTKTQGFITEIPAGEKSETQKQEAPSVAIRDDRIWFKDAVVTTEELGQKLKALELGNKAKETDRMVLMEAVGSVAYQDYFEVMSIISANGGVIAIVKEDESGRRR